MKISSRDHGGTRPPQNIKRCHHSSWMTLFILVVMYSSTMLCKDSELMCIETNGEILEIKNLLVSADPMTVGAASTL